MRRLACFLSALLLLTACGGKKARVSVPVSALPGASSSAGTNRSSTPAPTTSSIPKSELEGLASYYAEPYHGRKTSNGETFDSYKDMTAAHRTLPFNTLVRVTNQSNGQSVDVRINDRGPFVNGRVIDLSYVAAQRINMIRAGIAPVKLTVLKEGDGGRVSSVEPPPVGAVYAVQVGAFENKKSAEDLKNRLERKYNSVSIQTSTDQVTLYRVRIGREPDMASAQKLAVQLRKDDLSTFVVRVI